jgi:hypothetical protein
MSDAPSIVDKARTPEPDALREFLAHAAMVRDYAEDEPEQHLSEASTRTFCILPVLHLLGYGGIVDLREEVRIPDTGKFLDYELRIDGRPVVIVEAKPLGHALTSQDGGQCVEYASVWGVRWCLVTNGLDWEVFDGRAPGALATKKVAAVNVGSDDAAARAWSVLSLFSRQSFARSAPLTRLLVDRVVQDELHRSDSAAVLAIQQTVKQRFVEDVSGPAIVDSVTRLFRPEFAASDPPTEAKPFGRSESRPPSDIQELIDNRRMPPDAVIECTANGVRHTARLRDGKIELDGKLYSPSAAARAVLKGGAVNGWIKWFYEGESLWDIRARLRDEEHSPPTH